MASSLSRIRSFIKDDSLTDGEIEIALEDSMSFLEQEFPSFVDNERAHRYYACFLLEKSGNLGSVQSVSNDGLTTSYADIKKYSASHFLDLFYSVVGRDRVALV